MVFDMKTSLTIGTITFYLSYFDEYVLTFKRPQKEKKHNSYFIGEKESPTVFWFGFLFS